MSRLFHGDIGHEPSLNPPESIPVFYCDWCGGEIYDGDAYYEIGKECVCESCIDQQKRFAEVEDD